MEKRGILDQFYKGLADAITDIREKVVEEPWFGRPVTERESLTVAWPEAKETQAIDCAAPERDHAPEPDIDR